MATNTSINSAPQSDRTAPNLDRVDRWIAFWDVWSQTLPPEASEQEYCDLTQQAFDEFEKQDVATQAQMIAKAWGIAKTLPKHRCRKPPIQPKAVVVPPTPRWEPCPYWRGEECHIHKHAMAQSEPDTPYQKAESLFKLYSPFVRRRILVELAPVVKRGYDVTNFESMVWWAVAHRMPEYIPFMETHLDDEGDYWTDANDKKRARAQMWLKSVVHTEVKDGIRGEHLKEGRNIDREVPIPDYAGDRGLVNPEDPTFARPTPTAGIWNKMRENDATRWDAANAF